MDLKQFSWEIFTILCQGTIGGLIVVFFSEWYKHRRRKALLSKISDVLIIELESHLVIWEKILSNEPVIAEDVTVLREHSLWNSNQDLISDMDIMHFRIIAFYYRTAFQTLERLNVRAFHLTNIQTLYLTAQQCICCFGLYSKDKTINRIAYASELQNLELKLREIDTMCPK